MWTPGVMTMKMMSRTRTTSTNGVTLMSYLIVPEPPTCMCLPLSRFLRLGDEAHVVEADLAARLQHVEDVARLDELVALDGDLAVRRPLMDLIELRRHLVLPHDVRSEIDGTVGLDRDLELFLRVRGLLRLRGDGQVHRHTLLQHGSDDHEDDQEHQADVDERSDVDVRGQCGLGELVGGTMPLVTFHWLPLPLGSRSTSPSRSWTSRP